MSRIGTVGNPYIFPGFSLHDELGLLVQAGLTPLGALLGRATLAKMGAEVEAAAAGR